MSTFLIGCSHGWEFAKVSRIDVEELSSAAEEGSDEGDNDSLACVFLHPSRLRAHQSRRDGADRFRNVAATRPVWNLFYALSQLVLQEQGKTTCLVRT